MRPLPSMTKYLWLVLFSMIFLVYSNQAIAAAKENVNNQSKQTSNKDIITGAFGIKFGENIRSYFEGEGYYSNSSLYEQGFDLRYVVLKPSVNLKEMFPDAHTIQLSGIADDNDRVIVIKIETLSRTLASRCGQHPTVRAIMEHLGEKYKITKAQEEWSGVAEYGDVEGNTIKTQCTGNMFDIRYTSHLLSEYIERLKVKRQNFKEELKTSLKKIM